MSYPLYVGYCWIQFANILLYRAHECSFCYNYLTIYIYISHITNALINIDFCSMFMFMKDIGL